MLSTRFKLSLVFIITLSTAAFAQTGKQAVFTEDPTNTKSSNFSSKSYNSSNKIRTPIQVNRSNEVPATIPKKIIPHLADKPGWDTESPVTYRVAETNESDSVTNLAYNANTNSLMLRPFSKRVISENTSERRIEIVCDLILKSSQPIDGTGVAGVIDLSKFPLDNEHIVEVNFEYVAMFNQNKVDSNLEVIDVELSKTDKVDIRINNKSLLRVVLIVEQDIGKSSNSSADIFRSAVIHSSGVVMANGDFSVLKSSKNRFLDINTGVLRTGEQLLPDLNLITKNVDCNGLGSAEICKPESLSGNVGLAQLWNNGRTTSEVSELIASSYNVKITYQGDIIADVDFEINDVKDIEAEIKIDESISTNARFIATDFIHLDVGVDIPVDKTVEFYIKSCE